MNRSLIILSIIFLTAVHAYAGSLKTVNSGKNFSIARQVVINGKDIAPEDYGELRDIITKNGGTILYKFSVKSLVGPTISIKHTDKVKGSSDRNAFHIEVSQTSVKVTYTSPSSLKKAVETLKSLIVTDVTGTRCIRGGKYTWINDPGEKVVNEKKSHMAGEIKSLISALDKMAAGSETELILITPTDWMVESPVMEEFDTKKVLYSQSGYVSCQQLKEVQEKAFNRGVTVKVIMEFNEENIPFKEVTGHSLFSPEGMRFIRAALQQWHDMCGLKAVYVGKRANDDMVSKRFDDFLDTISPMIGIQFYH